MLIEEPAEATRLALEIDDVNWKLFNPVSLEIVSKAIVCLVRAHLRGHSGLNVVIGNCIQLEAPKSIKLHYTISSTASKTVQTRVSRWRLTVELWSIVGERAEKLVEVISTLWLLVHFSKHIFPLTSYPAQFWSQLPPDQAAILCLGIEWLIGSEEMNAWTVCMRLEDVKTAKLYSVATNSLDGNILVSLTGFLGKVFQVYPKSLTLQCMWMWRSIRLEKLVSKNLQPLSTWWEEKMDILQDGDSLMQF